MGLIWVLHRTERVIVLCRAFGLSTLHRSRLLLIGRAHARSTPLPQTISVEISSGPARGSRTRECRAGTNVIQMSQGSDAIAPSTIYVAGLFTLMQGAIRNPSQEDSCADSPCLPQRNRCIPTTSAKRPKTCKGLAIPYSQYAPTSKNYYYSTERHRITRKVDLRLLSISTLLYLLSFLDR